MKSKKSKLIFSLAVLGSLTAALGLAACGKGCDKEKDGSKTESKLPAPEITATNDGLFWSEIETAKEYRYKWNEDGKWTKSKECFAEYPAAVGNYTLYVEALTSDGKSGRTTEFPLAVNTFDVSCQQVDNTLSFTGESVWYSVNGGEEAALDETSILDFTSAEVGTSYTVEYYAKGGVWVDETKTYYVDGAKQTASLTVTQLLSTPVLRLNAQGTGLEWTADANAVKYEVKVDGETTEVEATATSVAFPQEVGEHVIEVRALTNGSWSASRVAEFAFETKEFGIPDVTVTENDQSYNIVWDEGYAGWMKVSLNGGEFTVATDQSVPFSETTKLKLEAGYNADENVYYLESKTLSFGVRALPEIKFSKDGAITWNETDEGKEKTYFVSLETDGEKFGASLANTLNVSGEAAGDYIFKVYAGQYIDEGANSATLYLPSEVATLTFGVLPAPKLDYTTNKLLWSVDEKVSAYQYKIGDGEWTTATENGFAEVLNLATYHVRAIGSDQAPYFVTGKTATLRFDPNLVFDALGYQTIATFDEAGYGAQLANPLQTNNMTSTGTGEILTQGATAEEQAILDGANGGVMKLTAGSAGGRNVNEWGNSDGVSIELFKGYQPKAGSQIIIRLYMVSNVARETAWTRTQKTNPETGETYIEELPANKEGQIIFSVIGPSKAGDGSLSAQEIWPTIETDKWIEYTFDLGSAYLVGDSSKPGVTEVKYLNVMFQNNGKQGDAIYVDQVQYIERKPGVNLTEFDFDEHPELIKAFSHTAKTSLVTETVNGEEKQVAAGLGLWQADGAWTLNFKDLLFASGTKIFFWLKVVSESDNGGSINVNGSFKKSFANSSAWTQYEVVLGEKTTLTTLSFGVYNPSKSYSLYVSDFKIEGPTVVTDYMTIDFAAIGKMTDNVSAYHGDDASAGYVNNNLSYDETQQAIKVGNWRIYGGGGAGKGVFLSYPAAGEEGAITVQEGMTITAVVKAELVAAGTTTTQFTWGANGTAPSAAGKWFGELEAMNGGVSNGFVTLTKTIEAGNTLIGQNLDNLYISLYATGVRINIYVKSVTITLPNE